MAASEWAGADMTLLVLSALPVMVLSFYWLAIFRQSTNRNALYFSPLTFLLLSVIIGVFLRTWFVLLDPYAVARSQYLLAGADPKSIFPAGLISINIGLAAWLLGYHAFKRRTAPVAKYAYVFDNSRYHYFLGAIFLIGLVNAAYMLFQFQQAAPDGGFHISAKRYDVMPDGNRIISGVGYARYVYDFIVAAFFVLTLRFLTLREDPAKYLYFLVFVVVIFYPFAASSQSDIVYIVLFFIVAQSFIRGSVSPAHVLILLLITASTSAIMFELRLKKSVDVETEFVDPVDPAILAMERAGSAGGGSSGTDLGTGLPGQPQYVPRRGQRTLWDRGARAYHRLVQKLVYRPYLLGVVKTSLSVEKMQRSGDYLFGRSYAMLMVALVPRSLWPNKPIVRIGRYVGKEVFARTNYSGVPPGFIAEAFLNFGWAGIVIIGGLLGVLSKWVVLTFGNRFDGRNVMSVGIFAIAIIAIHGILSVDFLGGVMRGLRYLIPFLLIMALVYRREPLAETETQVQTAQVAE